MTPKMVGTILPTVESLRSDERAAAKVRSLKAAIGKTLEAQGFASKKVGDEVRYFKTPGRYVIVTSGGELRWFEIRDDGDYAIKGDK